VQASKGLGVNVSIGDTAGHILITSLNYLKNLLDGMGRRQKSKSFNLDFSHLKMVIFDEADELFIQ